MEQQVFERIRQLTAALSRRPIGQHGVVIARRTDEASKRTELIAITLWEDLDSLIAMLGPDWQRAVSFPGFEALVTEGHSDHFETLAANWEEVARIGKESEPRT
jgi:hypothetical protein